MRYLAHREKNIYLVAGDALFGTLVKIGTSQITGPYLVSNNLTLSMGGGGGGGGWGGVTRNVGCRLKLVISVESTLIFVLKVVDL